MYKSFEEIMNFSRANRAVYEEIREKMQWDKNLIPFVGAGMTAFAFPGWEKAIEQICDENLDSQESRENVKAILKNKLPDYLLDAAQQLEEKLGKINFAGQVAKLFGETRFVQHEKDLSSQAIFLLPLLFHGFVVTTNFDETIERVYNRHKKPFNAGVILPGRREALNRFLRGAGAGLFKVHGTVLGNTVEYDRIIFTKESYDKAYNGDTELKRDLKRVFENNVILFLGCSLAKDRTLSLLKEVLESGIDNYTIINCSEGEQDNKRRDLAELNIKAILYDAKSDGSGHNAVRIILEKLLEDTDPEGYQVFMRQFGNAKQNINPFMFNSGSSAFLGRDSEMKQLRQFIDSPTTDMSRFLWWGIVGPAGSGKSRIAWELSKEYAYKNWQTVFLKRDDYDCLSNLCEKYTGNTLIIADYVQQYAPQIGKWIDRESQNYRHSELRLLLLERENDGSFPWNEQIFNNGNETRLHNSLYKNEYLKIEPLEAKDIIGIINSFAQWQKSNSRDQIVELKKDWELIVVSHLAKMGKDFNRPLYALFLSDALIHGMMPTYWNRKNVLDYAVMREQHRIRENVRGLYNHREDDERLTDVLITIWIVATILRDISLDQLKDILPNEWTFINKRKNELRLVDERDLLLRVELLEMEKIPAMKPDLIGEYFVLNRIVNSKASNVLKIYNTVLRKQEQVESFFGLALGDNFEYINEKEGKYWLNIIPDAIVHTPYKLNAASLIGSIFEYCGSIDQRQRLLRIMKDCSLEIFDKSGETSSAYVNIGDVYNSVGEYDSALAMYNKALEISNRVSFSNHPDIAACYNKIGIVYFNRGEYDRALDYYDKAKEIYKNVLGKHTETAVCYNNIGSVYEIKGEYSKALNTYIEAKDIFEKVLGENHPDTARCYNNIGGAYFHMCDYDNALMWYVKAKDMFEMVLGINHPTTAMIYNNIGAVYNIKADYNIALQWYEKALTISEYILGETHPNTAICYNNIGSIHYEMGNLDDALEYYYKANAIDEKLLGSSHPSTANDYINIGSIYVKKQNYKTAVPWLQKALEAFEYSLGADHPSTVNTKRTIEYLKRTIGEY